MGHVPGPGPSTAFFPLTVLWLKCSAGRMARTPQPGHWTERTCFPHPSPLLLSSWVPPGCLSKGVQIKRALITAPSLMSTSGPLQQSHAPSNQPRHPRPFSHLSPSYPDQLYSTSHPRPFFPDPVVCCPLPNLSTHSRDLSSLDTTYSQMALHIHSLLQGFLNPPLLLEPIPSSRPIWETGPCPPRAFSQPCHILFLLPTLPACLLATPAPSLSPP